MPSRHLEHMVEIEDRREIQAQALKQRLPSGPPPTVGTRPDLIQHALEIIGGEGLEQHTPSAGPGRPPDPLRHSGAIDQNDRRGCAPLAWRHGIGIGHAGVQQQQIDLGALQRMCRASPIVMCLDNKPEIFQDMPAKHPRARVRVHN